MRPAHRPTRLEIILGEIVYRLTEAGPAWRRFRYRNLRGRCYVCPGRYGDHKFPCEVGQREMPL